MDTKIGDGHGTHWLFSGGLVRFRFMNTRYLVPSFSATSQLLVLPVLLSIAVVSACSEVRVVQSDDVRQIDDTILESNLESVVVPLPDAAEPFWMGNDNDLDEKPRHVVKLTKAFEVMKREVTQELYAEVMGTNPAFFKQCGLDCPVEKVRWIEAVEFANRLSEVLGMPSCYTIGNLGKVDWDQTCTGWRLPTEAEWEWMALSSIHDHPMLNKVAWFSNNSNNTTHPTCTLHPSENGLCDVFGNVQEWVWDVPEAYPDSTPEKPEVDPTGPQYGNHHVFRGGAWNRYAENITPTVRKDGAYLFRNNDLGLRLVRSVLSQ